MKPQISFIKKWLFCIYIFFFCAFFFVPRTHASTGILKQINFQGKVVNKTVGTNVANGNYDFTFKLYDAASGGSLIWTETRTGGNQVAVTDGIFQVSLGSVQALPGSVDFNTDNLYLDITFNGETMTSRVRFTAVPYAFNALKVAGLTVTDTTGTFTLTAGKTLSVANTLAFAGTDSTTITFQGTDTYVGRATTDTLTNKTVGSTGLIFSGASTDIDTAAAEGLALQGRAASSFTTTAGAISFQAAGTGTISTVQVGAGGAGSTTPDFLGLDVKSDTGDPAGGFEGAMYYNTFDNKFRCYQGSAWADCIGSGTSGPWTDSGTTSYLTDTTDELVLGGSSPLSSAKFSIDGDADQIQFILQGNATQTTSLAVFENSSGTDQFTLSNTGALGIEGAISDITGATVDISDNLDISGTLFAGTSDAFQVDATGNITTSATTGLTFSSTGGINFAGGTLSDSSDGVDIADNLEVAGNETISFTTTSTNQRGFDLTSGLTSATNGTHSGIRVNANYSGTSGAQAGLNGLDFTLNISGSGGTTTLAKGITGWATVGAGATVSNMVMANFANPTNSGTITSIMGAQIENFTVGTNNTNLLLGTSQAAGNWSLYNSSSYANYLEGTTGIGTAGADAKLDVLGTTEQLRLTYADGSTYSSFTVNSGGDLTIAPSGGDTIIAGTVTSSGLVTAQAGLTVTAGQTFTFNSDAFTDLTGAGLAVSSNALVVNLTSSGTTGSTSSNSGLEVSSSGLTLLKGCNDGQGLTYTDAGGWACATISGGTTTLTQAYDNDIDTGDTTITLSTADDSIIISNPTSSGTDSSFAFKINQQHTTAAVSAMDIIQASNGANGVNLTANAIDGETGLAITTNGLTSGKGLTIASSTTALTGNLFDVTLSGSNSNNTGSVMQVHNTGTANANTSLYIDHRATGTNNLAFRIDDESGDTTPLIVDGDGRLGIGTSTITGTTERLLQVGSTTNRGNAAVYGELISKGMKDLTTISNIKDIFVYDTSADSDGGRWIDWATTDKLSWYSETLDDSASTACNIATMDRCYSQNFPRKAILVVTSSELYIFDASTNTMWMKFSQNASGYALGVDANNDPSSVTASNGVIYVGTNGSAAGGLYMIDFVGDRMWNIDGTDRSGADLGISSRNTAITYNSDNNTNFDIATTGTVADWGKINDVSVATLQSSTTSVSAPFAPVNGITLVALATDSGLTVINLTGQKVLQYSDVADDDYNAVVVTRTGKLYGLNETQAQAERWNNIDDDEVSEVAGTPDKLWDQASVPALSKSTPTVNASSPDALEVVEHGSLSLDNSDLIYVGTDQGLTEIHDNITTSTMGWSKFYNITEQTALMPGTVKGAFMFNQSASPATDSSFRANSLTAKGTVTFGAQGVRGKAITPNGSTGYLCNDQANDGTCETDADYRVTTTAFNIQLWFKHSTSTPVASQTLIDHTSTALSGYRIYMTTSGTIVFGIDDDATSFPESAATSTQTYLDNQWHHLVAVRPNATGSTQLYIDGKYVATGNTPTTTGSLETGGTTAIFAVGATCGDATCSTGVANSFWNGSIDDIVLGMGGTTSTDQLNATTANIHQQVRRLYNDARPTLNRKVYDGAADTTSYSSTVITDSSSPAWIPNEFAGQIVKITSGSGSGQTRRIVSNTASTITMTPALVTTPASNDDFKIDPEALYGATNKVTAIGVTAEAPLGEARQLCVGTNSATDTGGVTCYNHQAGPNIIAQLYHSDNKNLDDSSTEWTGTGYDDIQSIDFSGRNLAIASGVHYWMESSDMRLGQGLDYLASKIFDIRGEILTDGISAVGSIGNEIGMTGGADLAENYYSSEALEAGSVVMLDATQSAGIKKTTGKYQKGMLGVVSTSPGLTLGESREGAYPVALVGRVPVKVTTEGGQIKAGDYVTSASLDGYGMRAMKAGIVLGKALEDMDMSNLTDCSSDSVARSCGTVSVFVNLTNTLGDPIEAIMTESDNSQGLSLSDNDGLVSDTSSISFFNNADVIGSSQKKTLAYLRSELAKNTDGIFASQLFTDKVSALEVVSPTIFTDLLVAKKIKADSIEGLEIFTNKISKLETDMKLFSSSSTEPVASSEAQVLSASAEVTQEATSSPTMAFDGTLHGLKVDGEATISGGLTVWGGTIIDGVLNVLHSITTENIIIGKWADFAGQTLFRGDIFFMGRPEFNKDTAGTVMIKKDTDRIEVVFDKEYKNMPVVNTTLQLESITKDDGTKEDLSDKEKALIAADYKYFISNKSKKGFTIILNKPAQDDVMFSWTAFIVTDSTTSPTPPVSN